jgi:hypothetical protein
VYLCYLDESGSPEPAGTSHFVLLGLSLPATAWKRRDDEVRAIKLAHRLGSAEVHTAWMLRRFPEQERISGFATMPDDARRAAVTVERKADLAKASLRGDQAVRTLARNYKATRQYTHLSSAERLAVVQQLASTIGSWTDVVLFADAQRKDSHVGSPEKLLSFAFEQIVTRFHHFLRSRNDGAVGLLVQDNNPTAAKQLTSLMRRFHDQGTKWSGIELIVETPLFVDSELTSMVQLADLCSYAVRRFIENSEHDLFDRIYPRFDRAGGRLVGLRHYTAKNPCSCRICTDHGR